MWKTLVRLVQHWAWVALAVCAIHYGGWSENLFSFLSVTFGLVMATAGAAVVLCEAEILRRIRSGKVPSPSQAQTGPRSKVLAVSNQVAFSVVAVLCAAQGWYWLAGVWLVDFAACCVVESLVTKVHEAHAEVNSKEGR